MDRLQLVMRVRSLTRDLSNSIFREIDVIDYINEGIDRFRQSIPELRGMAYLLDRNTTPKLLPEHYHHLLALYSASRCFGQDERHYQATNYMNEFETKLDELRTAIENGDLIITDENGAIVRADLITDQVEDVYFSKRYRLNDLDDGVEGVGS